MSNSAKPSDEPTREPTSEPSEASTSEPTAASQPTAASEAQGLLAELLEAGADKRPAAGPRTRVGWLVEWSSGQAPRVDFEGNEAGPLPARSTIPLDPAIILAAIRDERGVLLCFEDGKPHAPIITGLLQAPVEFEEPPEVWQDEDEEPDAEENEAEAEGSALSEVEAHIDGRRIELEAADEIVLRCGKASIVLRRNGRVVIRGTYVETRSRGVNRVKGGSVEIN